MNKEQRIEQVRELVKEKLGSNNSLLAHEVDWVCSEAKRERASVERDMSELTRTQLEHHRDWLAAGGTTAHAFELSLTNMALRTHDAEAENADLRQRIQELEEFLADREPPPGRYCYVARKSRERMRQRLQEAERVNGVLRGVLRAMRDEAKTEGSVSWATMDAAREALAQPSETSGSGNDRFERATELIRTLVDNDPEDMAGDGITVFEAWRKEALRFLGRPCELCGDEGYITVDEQTGGRRINCPECEDTTRATTGGQSDKGVLECPECGIESVHRWEDGWRCPNCGELHSPTEGAPEPTGDSQESGEALAALQALFDIAWNNTNDLENNFVTVKSEELIRQHLQREEQTQAGVPEAVRRLPDELYDISYEIEANSKGWSVDYVCGLQKAADMLRKRLAAHSYERNDSNEGCADSGGPSREELHAIADDHARSVVNMFAERDYVLPDKFAGLIVADMRLLAERVSNAAAPQSERED